MERRTIKSEGSTFMLLRKNEDTNAYISIGNISSCGYKTSSLVIMILLLRITVVRFSVLGERTNKQYLVRVMQLLR